MNNVGFWCQKATRITAFGEATGTGVAGEELFDF
jgi:hypothetical protein